MKNLRTEAIQVLMSILQVNDPIRNVGVKGLYALKPIEVAELKPTIEGLLAEYDEGKSCLEPLPLALVAIAAGSTDSRVVSTLLDTEAQDVYCELGPPYQDVFYVDDYKIDIPILPWEPAFKNLHWRAEDPRWPESDQRHYETNAWCWPHAVINFLPPSMLGGNVDLILRKMVGDLWMEGAFKGDHNFVFFDELMTKLGKIAPERVAAFCWLMQKRELLTTAIDYDKKRAADVLEEIVYQIEYFRDGYGVMDESEEELESWLKNARSEILELD